MPLVIHPNSFACCAERLAGATSRPKSSVIRDARATEGVTPNTNASEEMALSKSSEVISAKIRDASSIDDARSDRTKSDEVFEPVCCIFVDLVV